MPKIRRKSIENDFLLIFFLHAERGCRSIIYFNDFATPSFLFFCAEKEHLTPADLSGQPLNFKNHILFCIYFYVNIPYV